MRAGTAVEVDTVAAEISRAREPRPRALYSLMAEPSAAVRSFDAEALPHLDALYRVALRLTADATQAEDLVQDTMLKAYRSWRQYRPGTNAKGWLLTILRNTFINDYRRRKIEPIAMDLEAVEPHALFRAVEEVDPEGTFFSRIVDEKVLEAVDALPPEFREVLVLSDVEGMSYAEIADTLELPLGTVKSRLFRARRLLQARLYAYAVENEIGPAVVDRPEDIFAENTYYRGALTLQALRLEVGDEVFFRILKAFYRKYRHANADSQDFIEVAVRESGQPGVRQLLRAWLYDDALPPFPDAAAAAKAETAAKAAPPFVATAARRHAR